MVSPFHFQKLPCDERIAPPSMLSMKTHRVDAGRFTSARQRTAVEFALPGAGIGRTELLGTKRTFAASGKLVQTFNDRGPVA